MSTGSSNTQDTFIYKGKLAARMACHMGDRTARAICNILGDQPLFYIDYVDQEESELMDAALTDTGVPTEYYAQNVEELQRRMARLEGASQHIDGYARENIETAFDAAVAGLESDTHICTLADLEKAIGQSRMASAFYSDLKAKGLTLKLSTFVDTASYDRDQKSVYVNPRLPVPMAALMAARALRQAWVHMNGAAIHPLHFAPEEAILLNRIQKADLAVATIRAAWEMNLSGEKAAWARILTVSSYDLAVGFAREAIADFRALNNGHASHAAFERWFFSGRCKDVDRKLIQSMLADHHGLTFENQQVSRMVTNDIIARTGEMPMGKNYLSSLIEIILADPLFTEVRDRSNANFLWFIKFERSFRASEDVSGGNMEQSLQVAPQVNTGDTANAASTVVAFKAAPRMDSKVETRKTGTTDMATVYYIDHFLNFSNR